MATKPTLLTLPAELRLKIIRFAVLPYDSLALLRGVDGKDHGPSGKIKVIGHRKCFYCSTRGGGLCYGCQVFRQQSVNILKLSSSPWAPNTIPGLLTACRKLHEETADVFYGEVEFFASSSWYCEGDDDDPKDEIGSYVFFKDPSSWRYHIELFCITIKPYADRIRNFTIAFESGREFSDNIDRMCQMATKSLPKLQKLTVVVDVAWLATRPQAFRSVELAKVAKEIKVVVEVTCTEGGKQFKESNRDYKRYIEAVRRDIHAVMDGVLK